jgi:hypothetical protein
MEPKGALPHSQCPTVVHILNQMNPVHNFPPCSSKIYSNIILLLTPLGLLTKSLMNFSSLPYTLHNVFVLTICFKLIQFVLSDIPCFCSQKFC